MTEPYSSPPVAQDAASDVLNEEDVVHVPAAVADLAESLEHPQESTFLPDVSDWDRPDHWA